MPDYDSSWSNVFAHPEKVKRFFSEYWSRCHYLDGTSFIGYDDFDFYGPILTIRDIVGVLLLRKSGTNARREASACLGDVLSEYGYCFGDNKKLLLIEENPTFKKRIMVEENPPTFSWSVPYLRCHLCCREAVFCSWESILQAYSSLVGNNIRLEIFIAPDEGEAKNRCVRWYSSKNFTCDFYGPHHTWNTKRILYESQDVHQDLFKFFFHDSYNYPHSMSRHSLYDGKDSSLFHLMRRIVLFLDDIHSEMCQNKGRDVRLQVKVFSSELVVFEECEHGHWLCVLTLYNTEVFEDWCREWNVIREFASGMYDDCMGVSLRKMANKSYLSVEYMKCQIVDWLAGGEFDWVLETRGMVRDGIFGPSWLDYDT